MAEDCALAGGEHGRHPAPSLSQRRVAEGIDAEVEGMKKPGVDESGNEGGGDAECENLRARDDAVLAGSDPREHPSRWCGSVPHIGMDVRHLDDGAEGDGRGRAVLGDGVPFGAECMPKSSPRGAWRRGASNGAQSRMSTMTRRSSREPAARATVGDTV